MSNKKKFSFSFVFVIAIFLFVSGIFYFLRSAENTPEVVFKNVEKSIENHDRENFYKFVDVESILNSSYDEIVEGLADSDKTMGIEAREAVKNFTQMLKTPLLLSLRTAIDDYVATGKFNASENLGVKDILTKTGIDKVEYRGVEKISVNENEAVADIKVFQSEMEREFIFKVVLHMTDSGEWKIIGVQNFRDFIIQVGESRRDKLENYLSRTKEINSVHDEIIHDAEQKYHEILSQGSLGQENIRADLKNLMLDVVKRDWETRKQELLDLNVPTDAVTLHNLRIRICDLEISYATEYAQWMTDKKAATIKSAEEKRRQAQILRTEADILIERMEN